MLSFWWLSHSPEIIVATVVVYRMPVILCEEVEILNSIICGILVISQEVCTLVEVFWALRLRKGYTYSLKLYYLK